MGLGLAAPPQRRATRPLAVAGHQPSTASLLVHNRSAPPESSITDDNHLEPVPPAVAAAPRCRRHHRHDTSPRSHHAVAKAAAPPRPLLSVTLSPATATRAASSARGGEGPRCRQRPGFARWRHPAAARRGRRGRGAGADGARVPSPSPAGATREGERKFFTVLGIAFQIRSKTACQILD